MHDWRPFQAHHMHVEAIHNFRKDKRNVFVRIRIRGFTLSAARHEIRYTQSLHLTIYQLTLTVYKRSLLVLSVSLYFSPLWSQSPCPHLRLSPWYFIDSRLYSTTNSASPKGTLPTLI
jgi:hypothetical protein